MFFGIVLVIIGALMLLEQLHIIYWSFWSYIWPIIIIAFGVRMIISDKKRT